MAQQRVGSQAEEIFRNMDLDGSGCISRFEFCKALKPFFKESTTEEMNQWFDDVDSQGSAGAKKSPDGQLSLEEFHYVLGLRPPSELKKADIRMLFKKLDKDGNGRLSKEEFFQAAAETGYDFQEEHFDQCCGGDGKLDVEDFLGVFPDVQ